MAHRHFVKGLATALVFAGLAGCTGPSSGPASDEIGATITGPPPTSDDGSVKVRALTVTVPRHPDGQLVTADNGDAGDSVTIVHQPPGTQLRRADDSTAQLILPLPSSSTGWRLVVRVHAPRGATTVMQTDGTWGLIDHTGVLLLGVAPADRGFRTVRVGHVDSPFDDDTPARAVLGDGWRLHDPAPDGHSARTIRLVAQISATTRKHPQTAMTLGTRLIASVDVAPEPEHAGNRYVVTPTHWGRLGGALTRTYATAELVSITPAADTPSIKKQLKCHALGAAGKPTWDLESWRPDVSFLDYVLARCNPD